MPADLWVAGPSAATGYWHLPERTAATFVDGWVRTGDTYRRTAHGDYCFVGRTDELFKVGGEWVSPYEVEAVLLEHPNVEAAAVVAGSTAAGTLQTVAFVVTARRGGVRTGRARRALHAGASPASSGPASGASCPSCRRRRRVRFAATCCATSW